jgi:hypothetical protein
VIRHLVLLTALAVGAAVRVMALPLPGTEDVGTWKIWAYAASKQVTRVYGVGGHPPVRGVVRWGRLETTVDYPPAAIYTLAIVGHAYRAMDPAFSDGPALTRSIKLPGLLCNVLLTFVLVRTALRHSASIEAAQWVALAYWLNPATILNGEVLGYLDPLMMLPAILAFVLLHEQPGSETTRPRTVVGVAELAGASLALAVLTKPQAILLVPVFSMAAWHIGAGRLAGRAAVGCALAAMVLLSPFALVGALPNMWLAFGSFYARRNILSGYAANIWWIGNYVLRGWYLIPSLGFPKAFLVPVNRIMAISTFQEVGFPNPRPLATSVVALVSGWGMWRARRAGDLAVHALVASFTVHSFFVLGVGVHEHHMMLAVPLLALAGALRPSLRPLFYAISGIVALNMNLFYGIGLGRGWSIPRMMLGIDLGVLLSFANVACLIWHGRVLARETRSSALDAVIAAAR